MTTIGVLSFTLLLYFPLNRGRNHLPDTSLSSHPALGRDRRIILILLHSIRSSHFSVGSSYKHPNGNYLCTVEINPRINKAKLSRCISDYNSHLLYNSQSL